MRTAIWLGMASAALAGCGGASSSATTHAAAQTAHAARANIAAARALVAPYTGRTNPFPVTQPLVRRPGPATRYALLQCATPVCALFAQLFEGATRALGVHLSIVRAGPSVTSQQAAMGTIVSERPSGVILPGVSGDTTEAQIRQLHSLGIPVVSVGVVNASRYGISFDTAADPGISLLNGRLMAAWSVLQHGAGTNAVFYATPELTFSAYMQRGFDREMAALCPSCRVRNVTIPVADVGNSAPSLVVSDLEAHPRTNVAAFATEEAAIGLPAALRVAGIHIAVTGYAPPPAVLQYIKAGQITSGLDVDLPVSVWETVDALARLSTHEPLVDGERGGPPIEEFLERPQITFDPNMGWTAYPNFPQRFAKLWR
ncbi:MAG TPA: substrate-binding domain-containing protein [Solirubrobacteraceae bacterium]|nr:substrate-binding domain-containing protein [Solirubrobacteraceae bacterium]